MRYAMPPPVTEALVQLALYGCDCLTELLQVDNRNILHACALKMVMSLVYSWQPAVLSSAMQETGGSCSMMSINSSIVWNTTKLNVRCPAIAKLAHPTSRLLPLLLPRTHVPQRTPQRHTALAETAAAPLVDAQQVC